MRINLIFVLVLTLTITSCKTSRKVVGVYRTNFPSLGFFMTQIDLNNDSTFHYIFSGDLTHVELDGKYKINDKRLYLRFDKLKEEYKTLVFGTEENPDTVLNFEDWQNSHTYDLKIENGIEYHLKYRIDGDKLKSYNIETEKIVRKAKYFTDKKRYVLFGPSYKKKKWYLKKIN
jgi:hypothetical protein